MTGAADLLEIERGFAALISAHEENNKHDPDHWKPLPGDLARGHWRAIENILASARQEGMPVPAIILQQMELLAGYLARGIIPRSVTEANNVGRRYGPTQEWEIGLAIAYIAKVAAIVGDKKPVATISRMFNVARGTVQTWMREIPPSTPACSVEEFMVLLNEAAKRYKVAGRPGAAIHGG